MGTARATHMSNENIVMTLQNSLTCLVKNEVTTLLSQQIVRLREQFLNRLSTTLGSFILCPVATRILSIPPTSAACESNFSMWSITHTKIRNRLLTRKAGKLFY